MYSIGKTGCLSSCAVLCWSWGSQTQACSRGQNGWRGGGWRRKGESCGGWMWGQKFKIYRTAEPKRTWIVQVRCRKSTCLVMESMSRTYKSCSVRIPAERETCQNEVSPYMWEKPWPKQVSFTSSVHSDFPHEPLHELFQSGLSLRTFRISPSMMVWLIF